MAGGDAVACVRAIVCVSAGVGGGSCMTIAKSVGDVMVGMGGGSWEGVCDRRELFVYKDILLPAFERRSRVAASVGAGMGGLGGTSSWRSSFTTVRPPPALERVFMTLDVSGQ
eukprot:45414-Eustigmatos_ZCMA.PRE.1